MFSSTQNSPFRGIFALFLFLACLPVQSWAEDDSQKSRQEVEFGIEVARRGLWREAIYRWEKAVELNPSNASARNNLAIAYEQQGDFELAEREYKRALELDPNSIHIRQNYELFREAYEKRKRKERRANR
jgi:Flp pilus assembly protein TadD